MSRRLVAILMGIIVSFSSVAGEASESQRQSRGIKERKELMDKQKWRLKVR